MNDDTLFKGLEAADAILAEILSIPIAKALDPIDPDDFRVLTEQLARDLWGVAGAAHHEAVVRALARLDVDWANQPIEAGRKIAKHVNKILSEAAERIPFDTLEGKLRVRVKDTATSVIKEVTKKYKLHATVDATKVIPEKAADAAGKNLGNYVRNSNGEIAQRASEAARKIVEAGMKEGITNADLSRRLRQSLEVNYIDRSKAYYDMVAGVHLNRARTHASLGAMTAGGVREFEFVAVRDEVTTPQCRLLHKRRFPVAAALAKMNATAGGVDPREETPWIQENAKELYYKKNGEKHVIAEIEESGYGVVDGTGKFSNVLSDAKLAAAGVNIPPIHGNCRSTIVPVAGARNPAPTMADLSILDEISESEEEELLREDAALERAANLLGRCYRREMGDANDVQSRLTSRGNRYLLDKLVEAIAASFQDPETGVRRSTEAALKERTERAWKIAKMLVVDHGYSATHAGDTIAEYLRADLLGIAIVPSKRAAWSALR